MTICSFFLQGRCRYGEKCWNEHPRGGRGGGGGGGSGGGGGGGGGYGDYNRSGGGFGNRVWVNPSQRSGNYVQPSSFPRGGNDWNRGNSSTDKSSNFSFTTQNRFATLNTQNTFDRGDQGRGDENDRLLETIQKDMEIWEGSGQWPFSCYSVLKGPISGFMELSPEELRLEYYTGRASGDLQNYANSVQQLANQWRNRVQELKAMNPSMRTALISELNNPPSSQIQSQTPSVGFGAPNSGFPSSTPGLTSSSSGFETGGFGPVSQSSASFSFASPNPGFGNTGTQPSAPSGFGNTTAGSGQASSGFGSTAPSSAPSASSFSFASPSVSKESTSVFGSAAAFSFSSSTTGSFGSGFAPANPSMGTTFGLPSSSGAFGGTVPGAVTGVAAGSAESLFTAKTELTPDELREFSAKRFTLGQIPLRPPPADLLVV
ncbi:nucleoporin NUP42 [Chanos chanos]|uniref:Nucleoporin NUP42 n=1 Tax=Chanos chanos TaxID=29144 RepID=A0A6J2WP14_CHACN|nr:nucleoporin NUP42 [Chanos chanos]